MVVSLKVLSDPMFTSDRLSPPSSSQIRTCVLRLSVTSPGPRTPLFVVTHTRLSVTTPVTPQCRAFRDVLLGYLLVKVILERFFLVRSRRGPFVEDWGSEVVPLTVFLVSSRPFLEPPLRRYVLRSSDTPCGPCSSRSEQVKTPGRSVGYTGWTLENLRLKGRAGHYPRDMH